MYVLTEPHHHGQGVTQSQFLSEAGLNPEIIFEICCQIKAKESSLR